MKNPTDNPADPFKKALAEATKTMANDTELSVTYSVDPAGQTADSIRLPQVTRRMTRDEVLLARGTADAFALRHKFHDANVAARYMPQGQMARDLYEAMETARIEANRQVRYLSQSVNPVIPDQAAYPRAFENTLLALLIFSGIYLLISITVSILREQVSS